jgi:hypothetical protein
MVLDQAILRRREEEVPMVKQRIMNPTGKAALFGAPAPAALGDEPNTWRPLVT